MLPTRPTPVKTPCPAGKPSSGFNRIFSRPLPALIAENLAIWLSFGGLALLLWTTGLDTTIARSVYHPNLPSYSFTFATFLRQFGTLPGTLLTLAGLVLLFWPKLWQIRPLLYRCALVITLTAILGAGLTNQVVVKKIADRPRPTESVLTTSPTSYNDSFRGNSMPSGHAAMGFLIAAPFFPLRRNKPRLARALLIAGIAAGGIVGLSRMMLGAHFATDVLIAGAITLSAASLFSALSQRIARLSHRIVGAIILVMTLSVILGNRFTLTLTYPITQPFRQINLPCPITTIPSVSGSSPSPLLTVTLKGYGAPLSNLKLREDKDILTIQRHKGLYHHLTCTATLTTVPE